jgi:hypothetical protein
MSSLWFDIRYALRVFSAWPGTTAIALFSLGLGLAVNSAMFSLADGMFLRPLPVSDPQSLVWIDTVTTEDRHSGLSWRSSLELEETGGVFADIAVQNRRGALIERDGESDLVLLTIVSDTYFPMLGAQAAHGRLFSAELDAEAMAEPAIAISDSLWRRRFGGDTSLIGRTIRMNNGMFTVVGILPGDFRGLGRPDDNCNQLRARGARGDRGQPLPCMEGDARQSLFDPPCGIGAGQMAQSVWESHPPLPLIDRRCVGRVRWTNARRCIARAPGPGRSGHVDGCGPRAVIDRDGQPSLRHRGSRPAMTEVGQPWMVVGGVAACRPATRLCKGVPRATMEIDAAVAARLPMWLHRLRLFGRLTGTAPYSVRARPESKNLRRRAGSAPPRLSARPNGPWWKSASEPRPVRRPPDKARRRSGGDMTTECRGY